MCSFVQYQAKSSEKGNSSPMRTAGRGEPGQCGGGVPGGGAGGQQAPGKLA